MTRTLRVSRLLISSLACVVISAVAVAPARAQIDPLVTSLSIRVEALEAQAVTLRAEKLAEREALKRELQSLNAGMGEMQLKMNDVKLEIAQLRNEVAQLKSQQPAAPGNSPTPSKPVTQEPMTLRAPFTVKDAAGRTIFLVDVPADRNLPRAIVGNPTGAHVEVGPSPGGAAAIALFDESKEMLVALSGSPQRSFLRLRDNEQSASVGNIESIGTGVFLRKNNEQFADISADKTGAGTVRIFGVGGKVTASLSSVPEGGTLKTFNSQQKAVAAVFAGSDGGHVALTGPLGGNTAVQLSVTPTGGKVRLYPVEGGKARAELIADGDSGAMTIFNASGSSAAVIESGKSGSGHLVILNAAGENAVEAGAMNSGIGIVRAGPGGSGPAGNLGGGLLPASSIQGKTGGK